MSYSGCSSNHISTYAPITNKKFDVVVFLVIQREMVKLKSIKSCKNIMGKDGV
jgi:hypothetical protein